VGVWQAVEALFRAERSTCARHGGLAPTLACGRRRGVAAPDPVVATFHTWFPRSIGYGCCAGRSSGCSIATRRLIAVSRRGPGNHVALTSSAWRSCRTGVDTESSVPTALRPRTERRGCSGSVASSAAQRKSDVLRAMPAHLDRLPGTELTVWATARGAAAERAARALGSACERRLRGPLSGRRTMPAPTYTSAPHPCLVWRDAVEAMVRTRSSVSDILRSRRGGEGAAVSRVATRGMLGRERIARRRPTGEAMAGRAGLAEAVCLAGRGRNGCSTCTARVAMMGFDLLRSLRNARPAIAVVVSI